MERGKEMEIEMRISRQKKVCYIYTMEERDTIVFVGVTIIVVFSSCVGRKMGCDG